MQTQTFGKNSDTHNNRIRIDFADQEAKLFLNCENGDSLDRGSGLAVVLIWSFSEIC